MTLPTRRACARPDAMIVDWAVRRHGGGAADGDDPRFHAARFRAGARGYKSIVALMADMRQTLNANATCI
jgi:hypothetical protein